MLRCGKDGEGVGSLEQGELDLLCKISSIKQLEGRPVCVSPYRFAVNHLSFRTIGIFSSC